MYCTIKFISVIEASRFVTFEIESRSQTPFPQYHAAFALGIHVDDQSEDNKEGVIVYNIF